MKIVSRLLLLCLTVLPAACGLALPFERDAFGQDRVYALVTVFSPRHVEGGETTTVAGVLRGGKYYFDAAPALNRSIRGIERAFATPRSYRLMPPARVRAHPAYRAVAADPVPGRPPAVVVAPGYKFIVNDDKLARLARDLGVDGVIVARLNLRYKFYGHKLVGIAATGKTHPVVEVDLRFVDRNARTVWQFKEKKVWNTGAKSVDEGAVPERMYPLFAQAIPESIKAVLQRLDSRVAGK